ncbi:hypothetical protein TNCV_2713911 [Trichonephila clavipes]|nr:hypothetical protein TNCV_2713911 [Trichonephila clavipes]
MDTCNCVKMIETLAAPPNRVAEHGQLKPRIGTLTSTFAGLKEDTCTRTHSLLIKAERALSFCHGLGADFFNEY